MRHHPINVPRRALGALALLGAVACGGSRPAALPESTSVDPGRRYVFYLHSELSEQMGDTARTRQHGRYERVRIVREIGERGFTVIAPLRGPDTDAAAYADTGDPPGARARRRRRARRADHDRRLPEGRAHRAARRRAEREPRAQLRRDGGVSATRHHRRSQGIGSVQGRILSMFGEEDRQAGSCKRLFEQSPAPSPRARRSSPTARTPATSSARAAAG
jgi:hypothetical protein